jgi:hypothetical protein
MSAILPALSHQQLSEMTSDAELCHQVVDDRIVAYITGAESIDDYRRQLYGSVETRMRIALRLAILRRVILLFDAENRLFLVEPWLREFGAAGDTPARLIRDKGDDDKVSAIIAEAAEAWLNRRRRDEAVRR